MCETNRFLNFAILLLRHFLLSSQNGVNWPEISSTKNPLGKRTEKNGKILKVAHVAMEQIKVASDKNWKNGPFKDKKNYLGPTCSCNSAASRRTDCFVKRKCRLNSRSGRVKGSSLMRATRGRYRRGGGGGAFSMAAAWRRWRTTMLLSASMV